MTWIQLLTIVLANIGWCTTMFLWLRKESNADRKELVGLFLIMQKEIADFYGKIGVLEERTKK